MLCTLCVGQASALEYTMEAPDDYLFGRPTSDDTIYKWEDPNVDRSKNTALIPPGFGTPTSYLPGSGDPLTPNLIPGALDGGGLVSQTGSVNYPVIDTGNGGSSGQDVGYTNKMVDMFAAEHAEQVKLLCSNELMRVIIDHYGEDIEISPYDDTHFTVIIEVNPSGTFYGWVFKFMGKIRILSPQSCVDKMQDIARTFI